MSYHQAGLRLLGSIGPRQLPGRGHRDPRPLAGSPLPLAALDLLGGMTSRDVFNKRAGGLGS